MSNTESNTLEQVMARHCAFWHRLPVDEPLLTMTPWREYTFYEPFPLADGTAADARVALAPGTIDARTYFERVRPTRLLDGDFLQPWTPYDACWMEAMLGCTPVAESGTTWAQPFIHEWAQIDTVVHGGATGWLDEFVRVHRLLASMAGDEPTGQPLMRGPTDMVLAAMGSEMFSTGFYEHPRELLALLEHCTELRLSAAHARLKAVPPFRGGYCGRDVWGLWAPGRLLDFQEDAVGLLSPKMYRNFVVPLDRHMAGQFDYSIMHLHSGQLQMLEAVLEIPELTAIQIAIDPPPYAPPAGALLAHFEAVQRAEKSLLLTGPVSQGDLTRLLDTLAPVGLALRLGLMADDPAEQ